MQTDVGAWLSSVQPGIHNCCWINDGYSDGEFKIDATTPEILEIQRVDDSTLYDALEVSLMLMIKLVYKTLIRLIYYNL